MTGGNVLIGSTGLVGSNLSRTGTFDVRINSTNADTLRGGTFDSVVFSAARAEKWRANADPTADAAHIDELIDLLGSFRTQRLTVISTVDVFTRPSGVDETTPPELDGLHPYGAGRLRLEAAARHLHPDVLTVRLPALFGPGLKKNVVYDLLHGNAVDRIDPRSTFQWYDLTRLGSDLQRAWAMREKLVHLVPEPVSTADVVRVAFRRAALAPPPMAVAMHYDVRSTVAAGFDGAGHYLEPAARVLEKLRAYVLSEERA